MVDKKKQGIQEGKKEFLQIIDEQKRSIEDAYPNGEFECCIEELDKIKESIEEKKC